MSELTFDLDKNDTLLFHILDELHEYGMDLINNEFKDIFKERKVYFNRVTTLRLYHRLILKPAGRLTKKLLRDKAREFMFRYENCTFVAGNASYIDENNKVRICDLNIEIIAEKMYFHILQNIEHLDLLMDSFKQSIRHEIGHLIDYISQDGMDPDDYRALKKRDREAFVRFREKYEDVEYSFENEIKRLHDYYDLPAESRANKNVNLDVEDILKLDFDLGYNDKDFKMKLTINSDVELFDNKEEEKKDAD